MKNQDNINSNVSLIQYPKTGIFPLFFKKPIANKILPYQKALYFCTAKQKMILNLHIHHHHFTHSG